MTCNARRFVVPSAPPGLLVSVRSAAEARTALAGGADVIDVKEPSSGSLGAADLSTIRAIVQVVRGQATVSAAAGELSDWPTSTWSEPVPDGVTLVKLGLAGCGAQSDWPVRWRRAMAALAGTAQPVAVAYADWQAAAAPHPEDVLATAAAFGCPVLLVDTWGKSRGTLFDHWPMGRLERFASLTREHRIALVLAGSLAGDALLSATRLHPALIAVRGAACDTDRRGTISLARVRAVREILAVATRPATASTMGTCRTSGHSSP